MFNFFKRKAVTSSERRPLKLPSIPKAKRTSSEIMSLLKKGIPIWAWYSLLDKPNVSAIATVTGNYLDGFAMWRIEGNYLMKYVAHFDDNRRIHLMLREVCEASNSNIAMLVSREMEDAFDIMYDDEHFTENALVFVHDVTQEKIKDQLKDKRVWYIGEEHFYLRKDYPDGLPKVIPE